MEKTGHFQKQTSAVLMCSTALMALGECSPSSLSVGAEGPAYDPDNHAADEGVAECRFCDPSTVAELSQVLKNSVGSWWERRLGMETDAEDAPRIWAQQQHVSLWLRPHRSLCLISRYRQLTSDVSMLTVTRHRWEGSREPAGRERVGWINQTSISCLPCSL